MGKSGYLFVVASIVLICICASFTHASDSITALLGTPISVTGPNGVCKKVTNNSPTGASLYVPTTTTAEWQSFYSAPPAGVTFESCIVIIPVPCTTNVNLYTVAGSPMSPGSYTFEIPSGCIVGSYSTSTPALTTGNWPAGSSVTLINNGYIEGMGGAGNIGDWEGGPQNFYGYPGGLALSVTSPISIKNNGGIYGGGGGGAGGYAFWVNYFSRNRWLGSGGGGGGGQGYSTSAGGMGGHYRADWGSYVTGYGYDGGNGSQSGGGAGGVSAGGGRSYPSGGNGGGWGQNGGASNVSGGSAGPAITGSGYGITWINYGDVRGPVQ